MGDVELDKVVDFSEPFLVKAWREILRSAFPTTGFPFSEAITARKIGGMVGHKLGYWQDLPTSKAAWNRFYSHKWFPRDAMSRKELFEIHRELRREVLKTIPKCLEIAVQQNQWDCRQFFEGFNAALKTGSLTKQGFVVGVGNTTLICWIIVFMGKRGVSRFESANHFHDVLTKALGHNVAGTLARTQKLCNRLELSFRKPGRPELKNKDNGSLPVS